MEHKPSKGKALGGDLTNAVTPELCGAYRDHMDTKIEDMEARIRWSIYLASSGMGIILMIFQYYLAVIHI